MSGYRLKPGKDQGEEVRRVVEKQAEHAISVLRAEEADPTEAVHEARKDVKRMRAVLRLVRSAIGRETYGRANEQLRDAARNLADVRDEQVRADVVDSLAQRFSEDHPPGGWSAVRVVLLGDEKPTEDLACMREKTAAEIETATAEVPDWSLDRSDFELIKPGVKRVYSRTRKRYRLAKDDPTDETLHAWRKSAKDFRYHLQLLRKIWPKELKATETEADRLTDCLGDDHDLAVLTAHIRDSAEPLTADQVNHLARQIAECRTELQTEAFLLGERLLAEKPKQFVKRIGSYWDADR